MNTAWGPAGLSEEVVHELLLWYEMFPEGPARTIHVLRRAEDGRLSSQQLAELMVLRGQQFLGSGPGREPWAIQFVRSVPGSQSEPSAREGEPQTSGPPGAPLPASAEVRLLDAGAELMLHDLASWLSTDEQGVRWQGAVAPFVTRLYRAYRSRLMSLTSSSHPRSTVMSASRSLVAYTSPSSKLLWELIIRSLEAVQAGNILAVQAIRMMTQLLGMVRSTADLALLQSAEALSSGWGKDADGAPAEAGRRRAADREESRAGKRRAVEDEAGNPIWAGAGATRSRTRSAAVGGTLDRNGDSANQGTRSGRQTDGSDRLQMVELIDRRWGRPGESLAGTGERTLPAYPVTTAGTVTALESLVIGARPAEELRHGLLSELVRRAGQVVLGTPLVAADVDPLAADTAAVRLLDVGVQLALHDLEVRAVGTAGDGDAVAIAGQETDLAGTGRVAPADLVPLLQQVYRERLEELLAGAAVDGEAADAAARSLQLLGDPCVQAAWADAAARIAAASSRATVAGPGPSLSESLSGGAATETADVPQALLRQVDLRLRSILEGMPGDAQGRYLVTRIARAVAVNAVHTQLRRGDLESRLSASPDPADAAALRAAAAAMGAWLYRQMVSQGRQRPATASFLPGIALPGEREAALTEVFAALRGLDVLGATVAGAGLAPGNASMLLNTLWAILADNAVHRVMTDASAETREMARRQLRHYGQAAGVTPSQPVPLWHRLAQDLAVSQQRPATIARVRIFAREMVRLLWRWAADPAAPVPPRTIAATLQWGIHLPAAAASRMVGPVPTAAEAWPRRGGPADPKPAATVPLAEVVPYARVTATVPARLASELRQRVGNLLDQLPNDTAGVFEAQLAVAGLVRGNLAGFSAIDRAELSPLASALSDALSSSLAAFGRMARAQAADQEPVVVHGAEPMDGVEPAGGAFPVETDAEQAASQALENLPSSVREVLEGLAPAVTRLAVGGWSRNTVIVLLGALRDAVINGVLGAVFPGSPEETVDLARRTLVRLWEEAGSPEVGGGTASTAGPRWVRLVSQLRAPTLARSLALAQAQWHAQVLAQAQVEAQVQAQAQAQVEAQVQAQAQVQVEAQAQVHVQAAAAALRRLTLRLAVPLSEWAAGARPTPQPPDAEGDGAAGTASHEGTREIWRNLTPAPGVQTVLFAPAPTRVARVVTMAALSRLQADVRDTAAPKATVPDVLGRSRPLPFTWLARLAQDGSPSARVEHPRQADTAQQPEDFQQLGDPWSESSGRARLPLTWGVIKGTAIPPDDEQWRVMQQKVVAAMVATEIGRRVPGGLDAGGRVDGGPLDQVR
jgi:hypothetical protein